MFIRFIRDYYLNANRMFVAGETIDVDQQFGARFIAEGAAVDVKVNLNASAVPMLTLAQTAIPMILPSSGSVGNNGDLTLTTALLATYPHAFVYFGAGVLFAGSLAGVYYTRFINTTQGTVYMDRYMYDTPAIPAVPTPIVATGPGAYTQTTAAINLVAVNVPGKLMGINGMLDIHTFYQYSNSANTKTLRTRFGNVSYLVLTPTTSVGTLNQTRILNAGELAVQYNPSSGVAQSAGPGNGVTSSVPLATAVDTSVDQLVTLQGQLAVATDFIMLQNFAVRVHPLN